MKKTVAIALSGGIDSLVSATLLKEQGHMVFGIHFVTGYEKPLVSSDEPLSKRVHEIAAGLDIPLQIVHIKDRFDQHVIRYFAQSYLEGKTPNPCLACNPEIKFGIILAHAEKLGASHLATGHYARVKQLDNGRYGLFTGVDPKKDQSYFLSRLNQEQLARAMFPLGDVKKSETIAIARKKGLEPAAKDESQDICFIKGCAYGDFIVKTLGVKPQKGPVKDSSEKVIGEHNGLHLFTTGQRKGINIPAQKPYYVLKIDMKTNTLVVGFKEETFGVKCRVSDINWIIPRPEAPFEADVRIRYRHKPTSAFIEPAGKNKALIKFKSPQSAVTPGQGAVFYKNDQVLGGGWIC